MTTTARRRWQALVVGAAIVTYVPATAAATTAAAVEVPTAVEAWFRSAPVGGEGDPVCATPAGCPVSPVPPAPPYPDDTLHVGATSGRADAVTYVTFATSAVPVGATLTGGTAVFPVAAAEDGTVAPDTAELRACLVTERFEPARGTAADDAPEPDCEVSVPASYLDDGEVPSVEVDLARFVADWDRPGAVAGLALVPDAEGTGTWHVAFSAREREQDGAAPPVTASLTYTKALPDAGDRATLDSPPDAEDDRSFPGASASSTGEPPAFSTGRSSAPPVANDPPAVAVPAPDDAGTAPAAPQVAPPPTAGQPVAAGPLPTGYAYPVVWLLPLLLALGGLLLVRTLSGEVEVLEADDPRDLIGRLWLAFFPNRQPTR